MTNRQKWQNEDEDWNLLKFHSKCKESEERRKSEIAEWRICKECLRQFPITVGEKEFFENKGLSVPVRCLIHRGNKR